MRRILVMCLVMLFVLTGCGGKNINQNSYMQISQQEAKTMMDGGDVVVLDVREQHEYDAGHIAGARLLPVGSIDEAGAAAVIPSKDTKVLVYCRSGNRSKTASAALVELGYTAVYEFGGINTWIYETE